MIVLSRIPNEYLSDHLFLLVGMNPLPNYVAARLLATPEANIYLLHTIETGKIARQLSNALKGSIRAQLSLFEIDSSDSAQIRVETKRIITRLENRGLDARRSRVGLNYTGGTAAMSVHVYHALEQAIPTIICSYLDAQTLSMRFDGRDGEQTRSALVGTAVDVSLNALALMHGYRSFDSVPLEPVFDHHRQLIVKAILRANLTETGRDQWVEYLNQSPFSPCPNLDRYPELEEYAKTIQDILGLSPNPDDLARLLCRQEKLSSCKNWLEGTWLEEYTLMAVQASAEQLAIGSLAMGVEPVGSRKFELDVAAMRGYQLFALSCQTGRSSGKGVKSKYKEHLLEIYVRARQLGGDEARVGLVCRYEDANALEEELREEWSVNEPVRVFGLLELPSLADHLRIWFETANT